MAQLYAFLCRYWEAAFEAEWHRLEPKLAEAVIESGRQIAFGGVYSVIRQLSPQLVVDEQNGEFGKDVPHDHEVDVTEESPLVLVPSVYVWPHVWVNCDPPWPLAVVYPAPAVAAESRPRIPSTELVRVLRSVADPTRLSALRLIAERPRSTQELAPLIGITEAGISKHLRALAEAGVLETRRSGYYVLYNLRRDRLESLSGAVLAFIDETPPPS
jgi:DNA-binding transcriptional ArsR family regulator